MSASRKAQRIFSPPSSGFYFLALGERKVSKIEESVMPKSEYIKARNTYGDWEIEKLRIVRKPLEGYQQNVPQMLSKVKSLLTTGKTPAIDRYFHTYTEFALKNPETGEKHVVMLEKTQTLNAKVNRSGGLDPSHDAMNIDISRMGKRTLNEYEERHKKYHEDVVGKSYEHYNVVKNNCQAFATTGLAGNDIITPEARTFINQPLEQVLPTWFEGAMQPLTDLAAKAHNFLDYFRGQSELKKSPISQHIKAPHHMSHQPHRIVLE